MIVYPDEWQSVGQPVSIKEIEDTLRLVLAEIDCECLSFSGGIDSSLLLYYMLEQGKKVKTFTIACDENHPDIKYSEMVISAFEGKFGVRIDSNWQVLKLDLFGDDLVKVFYDRLQQWTDSIIAGDGIDEFMAGYYAHQREPSEEVYYDYLHRLQEEQLAPLNNNSGSIKVNLPYIDKRLIYLMTQMPLSEKVDLYGRKKLLVELARGKLPEEAIERRKYGFATSAV